MHPQNDENLKRNSLRAGALRWQRAFHCALTLALMLGLFVIGCKAQTVQEGIKNIMPQPQEGEIIVTPIIHASLQLEFGGKVIHVDPTSTGDYTKAKQADLILVTDIHPDHLDPAAIARIRKPGAPVVAPKDAAPKIANATKLANRQSATVAGFSLEAVPMYNLKRGPSQGQLYHTRGRGNGYILTLGSKRVYIAGDTECTPEMRALKNIDIAFIPMNLPYTMPPSEAAECVKAFQPKVVYPYHYRKQKPEEFKAALAAEPIEVRLLQWYPDGSDK